MLGKGGISVLQIYLVHIEWESTMFKQETNQMYSPDDFSNGKKCIFPLQDTNLL